jgi:hypothetical protein
MDYHIGRLDAEFTVERMGIGYTDDLHIFRYGTCSGKDPQDRNGKRKPHFKTLSILN